MTGHTEVGALAETIQWPHRGMFNWRGLTQRYAGSKVAKAAEKQDITLEIVRPLQAKPGFVLLAPTMDCGKIFRMNNTMQEALKDYQCCTSILAVRHIVVFADFMFRNAAALFSQSAYPQGMVIAVASRPTGRLMATRLSEAFRLSAAADGCASRNTADSKMAG